MEQTQIAAIVFAALAVVVLCVTFVLLIISCCTEPTPPSHKFRSTHRQNRRYR